ESGDDRANRPGAWRAAVRDGAGVRLRDGGADLPGDGQLPDDERFRAVFLDGLRADCAEDFQRGEPEALAAVWRRRGAGPGKQTFHADFWIWVVRRVAVEPP